MKSIRMLVFMTGVIATLGFGAIQGRLRDPFQSDSAHFLNLSGRMAGGFGYSLDADHTFWPGKPSMQRMPLWPLVQVPFHRLLPSSVMPLAIRLINASFHGLAAVLLVLLTARLFGECRSAFIAGLFFACHPYLIDLAAGGLSEPLFLVLVMGGMLLLLQPNGIFQSPTSNVQCLTSMVRSSVFGLRSSVYLAAFLLGLACLVRANFILFPVFLGFAVFSLRSSVSCLRSAVCSLRSAVFPRLLALLLFYLPISVWVVRNAVVSGDFPVISTLRGQTFYGGNNPVVANRLDDWGYWVFPNAVEGEIPLSELSKTMGELDVDRYYMRKGMAYISGHFFEMPRLLLGKLIRAYVPLPWKPGVLPYAAGLYRLLVNLLGLLGLYLCWRRCPRWLPLAAALLLTNIATVLVFWGCGRFAMEAEPLVLLPFAGALLGGRIHGCKTQG